MTKTVFLTSINCIDGRVHLPVTEWMHRHFDVDYIDQITLAGPDLVLATGDSAAVASVKRHLEISISAHGSGILTMVGHHDCAANPATEAVHLQQIRAAVARIESWALPIRIIGLWVNDQFEVEKVCDVPAHHASSGAG